MIKLGGLVDLKPITEADVFTATSKETGTTSVFKSKAARDAAIKAGTHEKRKDDKDGAVKDPTDKPKVNIFDKPKKDKEEPKKDKSFNLTDDFIDAIRAQYKNVKSHTPEQDEALKQSLIDKLDKEQLKKLADANVNVVSDMAAKKLKDEEEPSKDSTGGRAGNPQVNKKALEVAKKVGLDPKKIGKEEFTLKIVQAAHEALTDSNFHSEARKLIAIIEDNPELAKNPADDPNKPDLGDPGYEEWQKGTAWGSKYGDSTDETDELGQAAAQEAGWAGRDALDSIAYVAKMKGFKNLAAKIQSVFDDEKNESSMRLSSMLPEGKHKKLERDLKNLAGVAKIDFSEALESLEEDGVLEAMDHLENLMDRIKDVHKQLKRKS